MAWRSLSTVKQKKEGKRAHEGNEDIKLVEFMLFSLKAVFSALIVSGSVVYCINVLKTQFSANMSKKLSPNSTT